MIKVLQNWSELGQWYQSLSARGLPLHFVAQKNFDFYHLHQLLDPIPRSAALVDLGCGDAGTLLFLRAMGFRELHGIDLKITWPTRAQQWVRAARGRALPYHLYQGDLTQTPFPGGRFDAGICISVIEHGVPLSKFFAEARRILKPSAPLLVSTDYWEPKIAQPSNAVADGLPWRISCRQDIEALVRLAKANGFSLLHDGPVPDCSERTVAWSSQRYTFVLLLFHRDS